MENLIVGALALLLALFLLVWAGVNRMSKPVRALEKESAKIEQDCRSVAMQEEAILDIEYESEYFNSLRPIVSAHRDGEGELCLEVLWGYRGTDDKLEDMRKEWNRSEELWPKLYQNQTIS